MSEPGRGLRDKATFLLLVTAVALVLYAGLCKELLFRAFEYVGSDLYSFLDMTWSWLYAGRLLHENAYGDHAAIHSFYLLPAFSPLTIPFGVHGLFGGLMLLELVAAVRIATARGLGLGARIAVLAGLVSPVAYFVFDDRDWGFHPELCYPPLGVLLALDLAEGRRRRPLLGALALVLVKEDGALLVAGVLVAHFAQRLWSLGRGDAAERQRLLQAALTSLAAVAVVFFGNLAVLWLLGRGLPPPQLTASGRIAQGLTVVSRALSGQALPERREALLSGLRFYGAVALVLLVPLGARIARGLALLLISVPGILAALLVSAGPYKFTLMEWAPRIATLLALVLACLVFATARAPSPRVVAVLVLLSWGLQVPLLRHLGYFLSRRANAMALVRGEGYRRAALPEDELRFLRCVAERLPRGVPVSPPRDAYPLFHHQSIVFQGLEGRASLPPVLRVVPASRVGEARSAGMCPGPVVGELALEAECSLLPKLASCGLVAEGGNH